MENVNPYQTPRAAVANASDRYEGEFQEMKIWSWRGRLGRLRFLAYGAVAYLLLLVLSVAIAFSAGTIGSESLFGALFWLLLIPYAVFVVLITIRRSHDMGWSGWMSLLALVPLLGLLWIFKAGSAGANAYGPPPPPNTAGVKFAAFGIFGFVMLSGILAAIAVPAYQQYLQRAAQAAQQPAPK